MADSQFVPKRPLGCDCFVVLPPATANGYIYFGKNADRPDTEVQEVVHVPAADHPAGSKVQTTFLEIEQVSHTHSVVLSKPAWMWGAEMGANEHGVCIGNEGVWTKLNGPGDGVERLLGMDLVRLGLERAKSSKEAVDVITSLLTEHGQGGPCTEDSDDSFYYHNSFMIVDRKEAWILETAGREWAAEKITAGARNISNELSIRTKIDDMSPNAKNLAAERGYWKSFQGEFDFAKVYSDCLVLDEGSRSAKLPRGRFEWGKKLMDDNIKESSFTLMNMMSILRHDEICMTGCFCTQGSQVSQIPPAGSNLPAVHWFTATPNPKRSIFKPFVFGTQPAILELTLSPSYGEDDPVKRKPRFLETVDRRHPLYKAHSKLLTIIREKDPKGESLAEMLKELEGSCMGDVQDILESYDEEKSLGKLATLFNHISRLEMNFYEMM